MTAVAEIAPEQVANYQEAVWRDPVGWLWQALGVRLWSKQREIVEAVRDHGRVAVRSGNACGKTRTAAVLIPWYLAANGPCYVVTTSSSWQGVSDILWPELRRTLAGHDLLRTP